MNLKFYKHIKTKRSDNIRTPSPLYNFKIRRSTPKFQRKDVNKLRLFHRLATKKFRRFVIPLILLILILLFGRYLKNSDLFLVKNVEISGTASFVNYADIEKVVKGNAMNQYIFSLDTDHLSFILKNSFLGAKEVTVKKSLPDTVIVNIVERVPLAVLYNPKDTIPEFFLVDEEGYILGLIDEQKTNLPKVEYNEPLEVGLFIDSNLVPLYLQLINSIDTNGLKASSISIEPKYINFYLNQKILVYLSNSKDIASSVRVVSNLLKQLDVNASNVNKIDLRYDKVVVQYDSN